MADTTTEQQEKRLIQLERDHGMMSRFLDAFDKRNKEEIANMRKAILELVKVLTRDATGHQWSSQKSKPCWASNNQRWDNEICPNHF